MSEPDLGSDEESENLASEQTRQRGDNAQALPSRPALDGHQCDDSLENMLEARQGSPHSMDLNGKAGGRELSVPRKGRPPRPKRRKLATGSM
ncbi:hypothetical protein CVIRNUC_010737 [Coccomyxa viridis]|uniref:Uncharacterized protein n=1 Tax=Coccomyxa viridis TaxID=1274662 RepID=A0AAV1IJS4_9CHLO|nr:hypothetical protein CVIRNUC_010737 [Coccomyxa viridis]